jgi:hypothetical protein
MTEPDPTLDHEHARLFLTAADPDAFRNIFRPLLDYIATIRVVDVEQPIDVHIDDIVTIGARTFIVARHLDDHTNPVGHPFDIPVDTIAHLHIW